MLVKYKHRHVNNDSLMSEACYQTLNTEITEKQVNKTQTKTHGMWCFMHHHIHHYIHKCCATLGISNSKQVLMKAFFFILMLQSLHLCASLTHLLTTAPSSLTVSLSTTRGSSTLLEPPTYANAWRMGKNTTLMQ